MNVNLRALPERFREVLATVDGGITVTDGSDADSKGIEVTGTGNVSVNAGGTNRGINLIGGVTAANGSVNLTATGTVTLGGAVTVGTGYVNVAAGGSLIVSAPIAVTSGNVRLAATTTVTISVTVGTGSGSLSVIAPAGLQLTTGATLTVAGGTLDLISSTGSITMATTALVQTNGGNIRLSAAQNVVLGRVDARTAGDRNGGTLTAQAAWGGVSVNATAGSITDADAAGDVLVNIYASGARLISGVAVGQPAPDNAVEIEVITVAVSTGAGGINLYDPTNLTVGTVDTTPANRVQTDGTVVVVQDSTSLSGITRTGGPFRISTGNLTSVVNLPTFAVVTVFNNTIPLRTETGLYEQKLTISNTTNSSIDAVRLAIRNLPTGVTVPYALGTINGAPYVQYNQALAPGQTVTITVEYAAASVNLFTSAPNFLVEVVPVLPPVTPAGSVVAGLTVVRLVNSQYLLGFPSEDNVTYYVQYRDNATDPWTTVRAPIYGKFGQFVWIDSGPTKTGSDPALVSSRQFQIIQLP